MALLVGAVDEASGGVVSLTLEQALDVAEQIAGKNHVEPAFVEGAAVVLAEVVKRLQSQLGRRL